MSHKEIDGEYVNGVHLTHCMNQRRTRVNGSDVRVSERLTVVFVVQLTDH
jgi:hypothetical protein